MRRHWLVVAVVVGTAPCGCGQILEVPVATSSDTGQTESSGDSEPSGETTTHDPSGAGSTLDVDDASTSSPADDGPSSSGGGPPETLPFCSRLGAGLEIPEDGSGSAATLEVPPLDDAVRLAVSIRVTHPRLADLRLVLHAPDGNTITLLDEPRCEGANVDATFEDGAAQLGNDQCLAADVAAITGSVAALDELDALLRTPVGGTWTLEIMDTVPQQTGYLDQVCVVLTVEGS